MKISEKIKNAPEDDRLFSGLSREEQIAAEFIASVATSIQAQRKLLGYTQEALAEKLGVSQAMVSRWENGEENFTVATLAKISAVLGIKLINPLSA